MKNITLYLQQLIDYILVLLYPPVIYTTCEELKKWNFDKISETNDFKYLVSGSEYGKKTEAPENAAQIWDNILQEYAEKTENNKSLQYFELLADISDMENRAYFAEVLLSQLNSRYHSMRDEIRKEYFKELRAVRFYINESKPLKEEIERLVRQLKAVKTKLESKTKEAQEFEKKNFKGDVNTTKLKVKIQRALKVNIDLKQISVSEWLEWINEATNGKE